MMVYGVFNSGTFICRHIDCVYKLQNLILPQMEMEFQAYLVQFFNEMGNKKKKKWEIRRRKSLCKLSQLHAFSVFKCKFEKFLLTAKAMCLRIKVAQLNTFRLEKFCVHMVLFRFKGQSWKAVYESRLSL